MAFALVAGIALHGVTSTTPLHADEGEPGLRDCQWVGPIPPLPRTCGVNTPTCATAGEWGLNWHCTDTPTMPPGNPPYNWDPDGDECYCEWF